jgi:hypothetical protein
MTFTSTIPALILSIMGFDAVRRGARSLSVSEQQTIEVCRIEHRRGFLGCMIQRLIATSLRSNDKRLEK